jgi:hypothetical protein
MINNTYKNVCKSCNNENMFSGLNLGNMPIGESIFKEKQNNHKLLETNMLICNCCGLGQLSYDASREEMFIDYAFKTSESQSFLNHANKYVNYVINEYNITKDDWILEIASNDGYMLKIFKENGIDALGVDPAKNIAMYALCNGLPTIVDFFGSSLAKEILRIKGYPKLIVANNVMAHVPDISDFMEGISILCNDKTIISVENPSIMNILQKNQFDTVYHGHYCYLSCNSVSVLAKKFGLSLFNVEEVPVHGISNRYWLSKTKQTKEIVNDTIKYEISHGLYDNQAWSNYQDSLQIKINNFYNKVYVLNQSGKKVSGYAASSKCTMLLNFANIDPDWIIKIADDMFEKQGGFIPGLNTPITSMEDVLKDNPDEIIIFSWNIYDEIVAKLKLAGYNGNIWKWDDK